MCVRACVGKLLPFLLGWCVRDGQMEASKQEQPNGSAFHLKSEGVSEVVERPRYYAQTSLQCEEAQ